MCLINWFVDSRKRTCFVFGLLPAQFTVLSQVNEKLSSIQMPIFNAIFHVKHGAQIQVDVFAESNSNELELKSQHADSGEVAVNSLRISPPTHLTSCSSTLKR